MGGGSTTTNTNSSSQSINEIPQWVQNAGQANYGLAQQVASQPLQQYQGQMVANPGPQTQQAWNLAANSGNVGVGAQNAAQAGYLNTLGSTPQQITAAQARGANPVTAAQGALAAPTTAQQAGLSQLANTNLNPYLNPYTQDVINKTLPIMQQGLAQSQNQQQNAANVANAYGGSRQAIQQGVTQAQGALAQEQMAAQLNQANYAQAQAAGQFDVGQANNMAQFNANQANQVGMYNQGQANNMAQFNAGQQNQVGLTNEQLANAMAQFNAGAQNTAAYQNQQAGLAQEQLANAASQGLGNLGSQQMQNNLANYGMLTSAGGFEQQQAQNDINAQMAKFQQAWSYPQQQLGIMESALGMTPYNTGTSGTSASTTTQTQNNPMASVLQGGQLLGSILSTPMTGGTSLGGSLASSLFGGSDRKLKTDIKKIDTHPSGVGIYSYRYKGDPKTYPKVVGPMAEDVAKIAPHAVRPMGVKGRLAVHMPTLDAMGGGATPPSSPGVAKAIGMLAKGTPGVLSASATPPSRSLLPRKQKGVPGAPIIGALGG